MPFVIHTSTVARQGKPHHRRLRYLVRPAPSRSTILSPPRPGNRLRPNPPQRSRVPAHVPRSPHPAVQTMAPCVFGRPARIRRSLLGPCGKSAAHNGPNRTPCEPPATCGIDTGGGTPGHGFDKSPHPTLWCDIMGHLVRSGPTSSQGQAPGRGGAGSRPGRTMHETSP
jgi:hypothetical protein